MPYRHKRICSYINPNFKLKYSNIYEYYKCINENDNLFNELSVQDKEVKIELYDLVLTPWIDFVKTAKGFKVPSWWNDYNQLKHNRVINYKLANLGNVLNALAGLYILELLYKDIIIEKYRSIFDYAEDYYIDYDLNYKSIFETILIETDCI